MFMIALLSPFTAPAISPRAISCGYPMGPRSKAALSHFVQAKTLAGGSSVAPAAAILNA
jgi:hypothetical protein